jgi:hypothetical protein
MFLDIPTLFIVSSCIAGLLGLFLFFAWIQDRNIRALAWWGAGYMLGGVGVALWIAEATLASDPLSYGLSNALLFAACGTIWNGARLFYARKVRPFALSAGAIVWIVACQFPSFAGSDMNRVILSSLIVSIYTFATHARSGPIAASVRARAGPRFAFRSCMASSSCRRSRWL